MFYFQLPNRTNSVYTMRRQYLPHFIRSDACQWCSGSVNHSPSSSGIFSYSVYVVSEIVCTVTGYSYQGDNHDSLVARAILLERDICFPCLSEYGHESIPALHIPCTAWNITFIPMIYHFHYCPRLFLHNTCRTDGSAGGWPRTRAGICKCWGRIYK